KPHQPLPSVIQKAKHTITLTRRHDPLTEIIDAKLSYPKTALLFVEFDSKQFPNIPKISCKPKMSIIRVPDNYDPVARTYTGTWYGGFKWAHSNNPAWVFYDILLSDLYGLGDRIDSTQIKEEELYRIAQYCDQPVPDGRGGTGKEPRFLCDIYIQSREEAWTVLTDLAAIFRGMTYRGQNQLVALADMPRDVDYIYTRANVINGKFSYASSSERTRHTTAIVSWSDPDNHYADAVEAVSDNGLVRRYGVNQTELTAIGCTRQSEANRRGRWALLTNSKDRVISFSVGLDGAIPLPGHIIGVADQMLAGRVIGGRIRSVSGRSLTLDRKPEAKPGDRLIINLPSGVSQARTVQAVSGNVVTVTVGYGETPAAESAWSIDADDLAIQQYRVTGISDNGDNTYSITASQHEPDKYAHIDSGARLEDRPISIIPPGVQAPPKNVKISETSAMIQGLSVATLRVSWENTENAIAYETEWRRDNGNWVPGPRTSALGFDVQGIYAGRYQARVRAINAAEISSIWANAPEMTLKGKIGEPPALASFTTTGQVFGIVLNWAFPPGAEDTQRTEIWYSRQSNGSGKMHLGDYAYPQRSHTMTGLAAGVNFWFQARLVDRLGNAGPWTAWTQGTSSNDAEIILDALKDKITQTQLAKDVLEPVKDASKLQDMWAVKVGKTVDGKQYLAGIGVGVENTPEGMQSQVLISADRFAVLNQPGGAGSAVSVPFAIDGGQVFMNSAFIKNGSITNAKIGESITSDDWIWNEDPSKTQGWAIDKRGAAWFNSAYIGGKVEANSGYFAGELRAYNGYFGGEIRGADGIFTGTVYAEKILGDVVSAGLWPAFSLVGVNDNTTRFFEGGLPYDSIVMIPFLSLTTHFTSINSSGQLVIYANGFEHTRMPFSSNQISSTRNSFNAPLVFDVPANANLTVTFSIQSVDKGYPINSSGPIAVMAFRKGKNRFS
ncbi:phage tail tip fiber protein, partial [Serratia fonticola]